MGDPDLARREYELLLDEFKATESLADVRKDVQRRMKLLEPDRQVSLLVDKVYDDFTSSFDIFVGFDKPPLV